MTADSSPPVIAIDGPAAAGKGTLARRLAEHYGFAYLDTWLFYTSDAAGEGARGGLGGGGGVLKKKR